MLRQCQGVREIVYQTGWLDFIEALEPFNDRENVITVAERWWDDTNSFHLPHCELTITPLDFYMITGISVGMGRPVPLEHGMSVDRVKSILGTFCGEIFYQRNLISLSALRTSFSSSALDLADDAPRDDPTVVDVTRAFLIYTMGSTFLSSSTGQLKTSYLGAFANLELVGTYDWGSCAMAWLYIYLNRVTRLQTKSLCGFWIILHVSIIFFIFC